MTSTALAFGSSPEAAILINLSIEISSEKPSVSANLNEKLAFVNPTGSGA